MRRHGADLAQGANDWHVHRQRDPYQQYEGVYYHASPTVFRDKILREGLSPNNGENGFYGNDASSNPQSSRDSGWLYLFSTYEGVVRWSNDLANYYPDTEDGNVDTWEVKITNQQIEVDPYADEFRTRDSVGPESIHYLGSVDLDNISCRECGGSIEGSSAGEEEGLCYKCSPSAGYSE